MTLMVCKSDLYFTRNGDYTKKKDKLFISFCVIGSLFTTTHQLIYCEGCTSC